MAQHGDEQIAGESLLSVDFIAVAHRDRLLHSESAPLSAATLACWPCITILDCQHQPGYGWLQGRRRSTSLI